MDERQFGAEISEVPEEIRVRLSGDLNGRAAEVLAGAYTQVAARGPRRVTLDFGRVGYINSTGIALVVRLLADARRDGRAVRALGLAGGGHVTGDAEDRRRSGSIELNCGGAHAASPSTISM